MLDYDIQTSLRRSRRAGYLRGRQAALQPKDRSAAVILARHAMAQLSDADAFALIAERATVDGDDESIVRSLAVVLGFICVLVPRLSIIRKALFISHVFQTMRQLMGIDVEDIDDTATLH